MGGELGRDLAEEQGRYVADESRPLIKFYYALSTIPGAIRARVDLIVWSTFSRIPTSLPAMTFVLSGPGARLIDFIVLSPVILTMVGGLLALGPALLILFEAGWELALVYTVPVAVTVNWATQRFKTWWQARRRAASNSP